MADPVVCASAELPSRVNMRTLCEPSTWST